MESEVRSDNFPSPQIPKSPNPQVPHTPAPMEELLYIEIPTPEIDRVRSWLQTKWQPEVGTIVITPDGLRLQFPNNTTTATPELSIFVWTLQRTTYLKVFRWADKSIAGEAQILKGLTTKIRQEFPATHPAPPDIDLSNQTIFAALEPYYPTTRNVLITGCCRVSASTQSHPH